MKSIFARAGSLATDPDAFYIKEQATPDPGPHDLLVRVLAIGMNPVDTRVRKIVDIDQVLGWDACGIVEAVGSKVQGFAIGDRVYYAGDIRRPGCNSEWHLVDHRIVALAPQQLSLEDTAAIPLTAITAWEGVFDRLGFQVASEANAGHCIMIIGGAGGVGSMAIQLARWAGLHVYATASRAETSRWCQKLGAHTILNHGNDLQAELKATGQEFVDAIFCTTHMKHHWQAMAHSIRPQGRVVLIDDPAEPLDLRIFKTKSASLVWEFMFTRSMFQTEDMQAQSGLLNRVAAMLDQNLLVTTRTRTVHGLRPENIQDMHIQQESGRMIGKQVLVV